MRRLDVISSSLAGGSQLLGTLSREQIRFGFRYGINGVCAIKSCIGKAGGTSTRVSSIFGSHGSGLTAAVSDDDDDLLSDGCFLLPTAVAGNGFGNGFGNGCGNGFGTPVLASAEATAGIESIEGIEAVRPAVGRGHVRVRLVGGGGHPNRRGGGG
jgi:hypothetical protein